jgi:hypothetical protein
MEQRAGRRTGLLEARRVGEAVETIEGVSHGARGVQWDGISHQSLCDGVGRRLVGRPAKKSVSLQKSQ